MDDTERQITNCVYSGEYALVGDLVFNQEGAAQTHQSLLKEYWNSSVFS